MNKKTPKKVKHSLFKSIFAFPALSPNPSNINTPSYPASVMASTPQAGTSAESFATKTNEQGKSIWNEEGENNMDSLKRKEK
jgi:hypothetical protein